MTTRAALRAAVRQRLEDESINPLWSDATLNAAIEDAINTYGAALPAQRITALVLAAGATRITLPAGTVDPARIVRVLDSRGRVVPPFRDDERAPLAGQCWRWWADGMTLGCAIGAPGETWTIEHRAARTLPVNDSATLDLEPGDEPIVTALTVAIALERRAIEDGKRGLPGFPPALAAAARSTADQLLRARRRSARMSG